MGQYSENLVAVVVACFLFSTEVLAQNTARSLWQGVLRDAVGVPIHGAGVHLKGKSGTFNATTSADGQFRFELIPSGQYRLLVDANHDKIQYAFPINIAGPSPAVVVTLSAQKSLSVTSVADQRPTTGGEELSSQTVSVLPLNKRDFSQLLLLAAGTMTDANGATNFTPKRSSTSAIVTSCQEIGLQLLATSNASAGEVVGTLEETRNVGSMHTRFLFADCLSKSFENAVALRSSELSDSRGRVELRLMQRVPSYAIGATSTNRRHFRSSH
jgi:hypothetical protein